MMTTRLEQLVIEVTTRLRNQQLTIATAESCTGGGLSYWLTSLAGSSNWFHCGFVTYSNESKLNVLGVPEATLLRFGAVSEEAVIAMAKGALVHSQAQISFAITGIAGPDGGTLEKPVGTVWFGCADRQQRIRTHLAQLSGDRQNIRVAAIETALFLLSQWLAPN